MTVSFPEPLVPPGGVAPVPRRLRGVLAGVEVFDTDRALYVWEDPPYPTYYVPFVDVDDDADAPGTVGGIGGTKRVAIGGRWRLCAYASPVTL